MEHARTHTDQTRILGLISVSAHYLQKRPLILGPLITHIALNTQLIDLANANLHIACTPHPLDIAALDQMGLLTRWNGLLCFTLSGESGARLGRRQRKASVGATRTPHLFLQRQFMIASTG
ncbi:UNVERIFIED_CONTAM: hypothetical protein Sradi_3802900 [Sesamum radiatum]|uniref:Uncharacterized protein n=1 Tax=Sesamum radiatum TaxID=300843 RepID=A0AAW2Q050_SESRA